MLNPECFKAQECFRYSRLERVSKEGGNKSKTRPRKDFLGDGGGDCYRPMVAEFSMQQLKDRRQDGQFQEVSMSATN